MSRPQEFQRLQSMRYRNVDNSCYSYKPFDQYRCIFVHIPKAAGISVSKALFKNLGGAHTTLRKYQIIFSRQEFCDYFKFTFVRNPWDRLFSAYNFLKKGGICDADEQWAEKYLTQYHDFETFVMTGLTREVIATSIHLTPQLDFISLPGFEGICVDFVGLFENIQPDFVYIKNQLHNADQAELKHENSTSKQKTNYQEFYSEVMIEKVKLLYRRDIELLGYNFDNSSLQDQLQKR